MGSEWLLYRYSGGNANTPPLRPNTAETKQWDLTTTDALGRTISASSNTATSPGARAPGHPMDTTRGSISSASTAHSTSDTTSSEPFLLRHGRRYLRNVAYYPLPCDLPELQRQNLHTLLATSIFGRALGSTPSPQNPPKKVLEVACGSAYWSSVCHDYLGGLGYEDVCRFHSRGAAIRLWSVPHTR